MKFVNLTAHKQWAGETVELALESYKARRKRQIGLLRASLTKAECGLQEAESLTADELEIV